MLAVAKFSFSFFFPWTAISLIFVWCGPKEKEEKERTLAVTLFSLSDQTWTVSSLRFFK